MFHLNIEYHVFNNKIFAVYCAACESYVEAISDVSDHRSRLKGECRYANIEFN